MKSLDRRDLLRLGAFGSLGAMTGRLAALCNPSAAFDAAAVPTYRKALVVFLRGANDGVNTIIPSGDATAYRAQRFLAGTGGVWIDPAPLRFVPGSTYAKINPFLHARLLAPINNGHVAFLHAMGTDNPSRSHFEEMDKLEQADETPGAKEGFVARLLDHVGSSSAVRGVSIASHMQRMFRSGDAGRITTHVRSVASYEFGAPVPYQRVRGNPTNNAGLWGCSAVVNPADDIDVLIRTTATRMMEAEADIANVRAWLATNHQPANYPTDASQVPAGAPAALNNGQSFKFMRELEEAKSMLLRTDCRVAGVDFGGFDTHNGQLPQHESLMQVLGWGLNSVYQDTVNVANNEVLILVVTEFGRTNAVNNSDGTDHGVGALCMAIGVNVRPGVYNCAANPNSFGEAWTTLGHNMTGIYENAVPTKTHFQTMIAEVCQRHFGLTAPQTDIVVPGFSGHAPTGIYRQLGFLL